MNQVLCKGLCFCDKQTRQYLPSWNMKTIGEIENKQGNEQIKRGLLNLSLKGIRKRVLIFP